jgi:hypothetical protein
MRTITSQSLTARTLYAELRDLALAAGMTENIGTMPGQTVLVGTHAFVVLGVRWFSRLQTQDVDLAGNTDIKLALPQTEVAARAEEIVRSGAGGRRSRCRAVTDSVQATAPA